MRNSLLVPFPTKSCLVLYCFGANLLHLLNMWVIVSYLSPHNIHLLFNNIIIVISQLFTAALTSGLRQGSGGLRRLGRFLETWEDLAGFWRPKETWHGSGDLRRLGTVLETWGDLAGFWRPEKIWQGSGDLRRLGRVLFYSFFLVLLQGPSIC